MTTPYSLWRTAVLGAIVLATAATVTGLMPLAHAACGDEWGACRANLTHAVFGTTVLPSRATPDFTHQPAVNNTNNMTVLTWTIAQPGGPTLNATVFHTLNTSGSAAGNYPCADPHPPIYPHGYGDTLVLYHNGHETSACVPNYDGVADYFNQLGLDVMEFDMPLIGCNRFANETTTSHQWFQQFEDKGVYTMPYFVEPVILSINYATQVLGYKRIVMVGLSGGGWTTTLAAALDPRIQLSFPIAGSIPFWMRTAKFGDIGDYEQLVQRPMYAAANYTDMYVLGALESGRAQIQILHEEDPCCYRAGTRHGQILEYNDNIAAALKATGGGGGVFRTAAVVGNVHQVDYRCKVIVSAITSRPSLDADGMNIPFDILRGEPPVVGA